MKKQATEYSMQRRGHISRIEGLSDSIFAFVATLLVMSLEVPRTFRDLRQRMAGETILVFAICFAILMLVWHTQNAYFREYELEDGFSLFWNSMLLLTVLFSVYPLKILVAYAIAPSAVGVEPNELPDLIAMFSAGIFMVSLVFTALFHHALDHVPGNIGKARTKLRVAIHLIDGIIAGLSWVIAQIGREQYLSASWWIYAFLLPCWLILYGRYRRSARAALAEQALSTSACH